MFLADTGAVPGPDLQPLGSDGDRVRARSAHVGTDTPV